MTTANFKEQMKEKYAKKLEALDEKLEAGTEQSTNEEQNVSIQSRDEIGGRQSDSGSDHKSETEGSGDSQQNQDQEVRTEAKKPRKKEGDETSNGFVPSFLHKPEQGDAQNGFVPSSLYKQQKDEAREAERRAAAAEAALLALKSPPKQPEEDIEPDYASQPDAWYRWDSRQKAKQIQQLSDQLSKSHQTQQINNAFQHLDSALDTDIYTFRQTRADVDDAMRFLADAQFKQNALKGLDVAANRQLIQNGFRNMTAEALQKGYSPAEYAYAIADAWGYRPQMNGTKPAAKQQSLSKLNENIRRNTGLTGASGATEGDVQGEILDEVKQGRKEIFAKSGMQSRQKLEEWRKKIAKI